MTLLAVWLHLLAAVSWIGGMVFLSLVLVPALKRQGAASQRAALFRAIALRFRAVVWSSVGVLLVTGPLLLAHRGLSLLEPSRWPAAVTAKLSLVLLLVALTGAHDFVLGPRVAQLQRTPEVQLGRTDRWLVLWSPWLARLSLVLALGVLLCAAVLARA
jgi:uncharacterized membrane protein